MKKLLKAIALSLVSSFCLLGCVPEGLSSTSEKEDVSVIISRLMNEEGC